MPDEKAAPPPELTELVSRFDEQREDYRSGHYNETQVRREFIDPLFALLGWDVDSKQGHAEQYKDVIHEDAIRVGGLAKAPDYCFRIGGTRKFFVEAKKPSVNVREDISAAYQVRRYAWSAKLPLSILTDFEEFAVYDCRKRPERGDPPATGRILYITYSEYAKRWDEITSRFSKDAILKGAFDRFAESAKGKRGTTAVDASFLSEIESWRDALARHLALRNPALTQRELNFAVQRTIDRIIFLRICEDRGIEPYGQLQALLNGANTYPRLCGIFDNADDRYNSGLFHFHAEKDRLEPPDELSKKLAIDDKVLKDILKRLYYPDSPYEFSVLPADILGQVYEQFLGKVIRLTAGHQARVEEKPEVKKAGGVYYTPTYIVDYIVRHTVGRLLEGKTPKKVAELRILDPACGSGSFLIGAYQYLLDWHLQYYLDNGPEKSAEGRNPALVHTEGGWKLTTGERKRILLNNIYGVDIDSQAVEVTKLSLLLKVLEGETEESLTTQMTLLRQRALPDLGSNIKCGNSLIGPDFYQGQQLSLLDEEEMYRINVFDWNSDTDGFGTITKAGGFDAVVGNPPYILMEGRLRDDEQSGYLRTHYSVAAYKVDTYHLFIEKGIKLARAGGRCSMITPANFLTNNYLAALRSFMLDSSAVDQIAVIDGGVFHGISVDNAVFVVTAGLASAKPFDLHRFQADGAGLKRLSSIQIAPDASRSSSAVLFTGSTDLVAHRLWSKVEGASVRLGDVAYVNFGKQLRDRAYYPEDVVTLSSIRDAQPPYVPCYTGRDVQRYSLEWGNLACLNDPCARRGGCWEPDRHNDRAKILTRQIGRHPVYAIDTNGYHCLNTLFMVCVREHLPCAPRFLLGVLNSSLLRFLWLDRYYDKRNTFPKIKGTYLKELPVPALSDPADVARHDRMVSMVEHMLDLNKRLAAANTEQEKTVLKRQIEAADRQIDALVYELYGLTDEEIALVENAG